MSSFDEIHRRVTELGLHFKCECVEAPVGVQVTDLYVGVTLSGEKPRVHVQFSPAGRVTAAYIVRGKGFAKTRQPISGPFHTGSRAGKRAVMIVLPLLAKGLL